MGGVSSLEGKPVSLWMDTTPETDYPSLEKGLEVDVAIIGAGIAGLTAAALLKAAGKKVAVIEADRVGSGVTGHTTGKVSSLHHLAYTDIAKHHNKETAKIYGQANQAALERVEQFVHEAEIDCDFHREDNYTLAETDDGYAAAKGEADLAKSLGLPADFVTEVTAPFPVKGAVRFKHQARIHARRYLIGLARTVWGKGSYVFEQTRAVDVDEGEPCVVKTEKGQIKASDVIVATNIPFLDRGLFFTRAHPHRSYLIAARLKSKPSPGMFITAEQPLHSILPVTVGDTDYLLVGGEGHKAGQGGKISDRYRALEDYARDRFDILSIDYRWATQDPVSVDGLPYVGKINPFAKHLYVATAFRKWGLTNGTAAGMILADTLNGIANPWAKTFDTSRITPLAGGSKFISENLNAGLKFVAQRLKRGGSLEDLIEGEGKVIRSGGKQIAAYKDEAGNVQAVSAVCTHLQCIVEFNDAEKTWDCPCHGSRFATDGKVIQGPATKDLDKTTIT